MVVQRGNIYMGVTVIVKLATNGLRNWLEVRYFSE